ncbi:MAG: hypothetical protein ACRD2E_09250, partial [Terriglobales bacterium]
APPRPAAASLLDGLPRPASGAWRAAWQRAQARGAAGRTDAAWLEMFYGDAAVRAQAGRTLTLAAREQPASARLAWEQMVWEWMNGHQQREMRAALKLIRLAPDDPAAELAARQLSGTLSAEGRVALDAAPELRRILAGRLEDPATAYMLGRPLLSLVDAPGLKLTRAQASALAGRPRRWMLFGPFGQWRNLDFDRAFPIEKTVAAKYADGGQLRGGLPFTADRGVVAFPGAWSDRGVEYAETWVQVSRTGPFLLRVYAPTSWQLQINGRTVLRDDLRSSYHPAAAVAAVRLRAGWNRLLMKLGGEGDRHFSCMLRPLAGARPGGAGLLGVRGLPAGAHVAGAPALLAAPATLAAWARLRLRAHADDPVALWVQGVELMQDGDPEAARVALKHAAHLAPNATPVWLALAKDTLALPDASESWATAQGEQAARTAAATDPTALPAFGRIGGILQAEGKPNAAAASYARCAGRGYAPCDWAAFHLDLQRDWLPEARRALAYALAETPSGWGRLTDGLEFYNQMGDALRSQRLEAQLARDPRSASMLGRFWLHHGQPQRAATLLARAVAAEPSAASIRQDYLRALLAAGQTAAAQTAARQALGAFPYNEAIALAAADVSLSASRAQGLAALQSDDYDRPQLRRAADFLAGNDFWLPWYRNGRQVIQGAPGKAQYPNAHSILVLDQMVDRINPDNSRDAYIHQVFRVLDSIGISSQETVNIPPDSDLILLRTIKQNGTVVLPTIRPGARSVTMPGLAPGDYIEVAYIMHTPPSQVVPGALDNNMFFVFNSSKQPYHFSEYVVLTRKGDPLMINTARFPRPAKVTQIGDWVAHRWLIQHTRILGVEPDMPPEQDLVPRVWVSSELTWGEISQSYANATFAVRRNTPAMRATALQAAGPARLGAVARARRLFQWVAANIHAAPGPALAPARQAFVDRSGNRLSVFLGLLSAVDVPWQLALARPVTDHSTLKIPNVFTFQYPLVRVTGPQGATAWFDLNGAFARTGYINPAFRGGAALLVGGSPDDPFTTVPQTRSPLDELATDANIQVQTNGDATLTLTLRFRGPLGQDIRQTLQGLPAAQLPQIYQQVLLRNYPNATATGGKLVGLNARDRALSIVVQAQIPGFVQINGTQWELDRLAGPVGVLARYAQLPSRVHPLVIPAESFETTDVRVQLPRNLANPATPRDLDLTSPYGAFRAIYQVTGRQLTLRRSVDLPADYIPPAAYPAFRQFSKEVDSQDHLPITGVVAASSSH